MTDEQIRIAMAEACGYILPLTHDYCGATPDYINGNRNSMETVLHMLKEKQ